MSEDRRYAAGDSAEPDQDTSPRSGSLGEAAERKANWRLRVIALLIALPTLVILYLVSASFFPRWWAHRIGSMSDGQFHKGISVGLFYGFVFTLVSLVVVRQIFRRRFSWKVRGSLLVVAMAISFPNLLTLGIVMGSSSAAHAGQRTLDTGAPGFRGASLVGVILAAVLAAGAQYLWTSRKRTRRTVKELKSKVREHEAVPPQQPPQPPGQPQTQQTQPIQPDDQADH